MLFSLETKFHMKNYCINFSLSSYIFLKLFLFSNTKNSKFSKNNNIFEEILKEAYFLESSKSPPPNLSGYPYCHPPSNTKVLSSHPTATLNFLPWWFIISKVMSGVLRLIEVESEFNYDFLLYYWLKFNLVERCILSKRSLNVIHQVNIKKLIIIKITDYSPLPPAISHQMVTTLCNKKIYFSFGCSSTRLPHVPI